MRIYLCAVILRRKNWSLLIWCFEVWLKVEKVDENRNETENFNLKHKRMKIFLLFKNKNQRFAQNSDEKLASMHFDWLYHLKERIWFSASVSIGHLKVKAHNKLLRWGEFFCLFWFSFGNLEFFRQIVAILLVLSGIVGLGGFGLQWSLENFSYSFVSGSGCRATNVNIIRRTFWAFLSGHC